MRITIEQLKRIIKEEVSKENESVDEAVDPASLVNTAESLKSLLAATPPAVIAGVLGMAGLESLISKIKAKKEEKPLGESKRRASNHNELRNMIRREVRKAIVSPLQEQTQSTSEMILKAFKDFAERSSLMEDPGVQEAIQNNDYTTDYNDVERTNELILGTGESGGGDYLFQAFRKKGLIPKLQKHIENYLNNNAPPTKKSRRVHVIPYSEYQWNEDKWGDEL